MDILPAIILGVVEGFTEFLPISSTAHLALTSQLIGVEMSGFTGTFEIAIQSGAILAVLAIYWRKFLDWTVLKKLAIAFVPTGALGIILYPFIKHYLLNNIGLMLTALALGGLFLIVFERYYKPLNEINSFRDLRPGQLLAIGLFQAIAMVPGISRAAATIVGGLTLGLKRAAIVEFSFLLAAPTMLAATGYDLLKNYSEISLADFDLLSLGLLTSFIVALLGIKFLLKYIRTHSFVGFGIYRLVIALVFWAILFAK